MYSAIRFVIQSYFFRKQLSGRIESMHVLFPAHSPKVLILPFVH